MTATQRFIEDAIKGGWVRDPGISGYPIDLSLKVFRASKWEDWQYKVVLLDKDAWIAVGKTRGWTEDSLVYLKECTTWGYNMHRFVDHLTDGKTIEEGLQAIENV